MLVVLVGGSGALLFSVTRWPRLFRRDADPLVVIGPMVAAVAMMLIGGGLVVISFPASLGRGPLGVALVGLGLAFTGFLVWRKARRFR